MADTRWFRTLADFANAVECVRPGDQVLLQGGSEFTGRLRLRECVDGGPAEGPLVVRGFNPGAPLDAGSPAPHAIVRAAPSAAELGLAWAAESAPAFRGKAIPHLRGRPLFKIGPFPRAVTQVFHGDERLPLASFPSSAPGSRSRYATFTAARGQDQGCPARACLTFAEPAAVAALRELSRLEGDGSMHAYAVVRSSPWSLARVAIAGVSADAGTVELRVAEPPHGPGRATANLPSGGHGAILMNSFAFLDEPGEWYYNPEDRHVYLVGRTSAPPPAAETRFALNEDTGAAQDDFGNAGIAFIGRGFAGGRAGGISSVRVEGLSVRQAAGSGIRVRKARSVEIVRNEARQAGLRGIAVNEAYGTVSVSGNRVQGSGTTGIGVHIAPVVEITGNTIEHVGTIGSQRMLEMDFAGIRLDGAYLSARIAANRIGDTGHAGIITMDPAPDPPGQPSAGKLEILDNEIARFCGMVNDCAGIYINGIGRDPLDAKVVAYGKRIAGNTITEPRVTLDGTPAGSGFPPGEGGMKPMGSWQKLVGAVYLDHRASYYEVTGNTVSGLYEPYSWIIRHRAIENSCSRALVDQCKRSAGDKAHACYSRPLNRCNRVAGP